MAGDSDRAPGSLAIPAIVVTILAFFGVLQKPGKPSKPASQPAAVAPTIGGAPTVQTGRPFSLSRLIREIAGPTQTDDDLRMLGQLEILQRHYLSRIASDPSLASRFLSGGEEKGDSAVAKAAAKDLLEWLLRGGASDPEQGDSIDCLVALVPDQTLSGSPYRYDLAIQSITLALRSAGYLIELHDLASMRNALAQSTDPTSGKGGADPDSRPPGVLLLKRTRPASRGREDLMLVFLATETPIRGITVPMLHAAFALSARCIELQGRADSIRVVGPYFSGSSASMVQAARQWSAAHARSPIGQRWINGSASALALTEILPMINGPGGQGPFRISTTLDSTADANAELFTFVDNHLRTMTDRSPIAVAFLTEESTGFGTHLDLHKGGPETRFRFVPYSFPLHVSEVRRRYTQQAANRGSADTLKLGDQEVPLRKEEELAFVDEGSPTPELPAISAPGMTAAYDELRLRETADEINRQGIRFICLSATDVRDTIFVLTYLREHCPDARLLTLTSDVALSHQDNATRLRGTIVASTYPLWTQGLLFESRKARATLPLPDNSSHGIHNAVIAHLVERDQERGGAETDTLLGQMVNYNAGSQESDRMAISVVGQDGFQHLAWPALGEGGVTPRGSYASFRWRAPEIAKLPQPSEDRDEAWGRLLGWKNGVTPLLPYSCVFLALGMLAWSQHVMRFEWRAARRPGWLRTAVFQAGEHRFDAVRNLREAWRQLVHEPPSSRPPGARPGMVQLARLAGVLLAVILLAFLLGLLLGQLPLLAKIAIATLLVGRLFLTPGRLSGRLAKVPGITFWPFRLLATSLVVFVMFLGGLIYRIGMIRSVEWLISPSVLSIFTVGAAAAILSRLAGPVPWIRVPGRAMGLALAGFIVIRVGTVESSSVLSTGLQGSLLALFLLALLHIERLINLWTRFQAITDAYLSLPVGDLFDRLPRRFTSTFASPVDAITGDGEHEFDVRRSDFRKWFQSRLGGDLGPSQWAGRILSEWESRVPSQALDPNRKPSEPGQTPTDAAGASRVEVSAAEEYFAIECVGSLNRVLDVIWHHVALTTVLGLLLMAAVNSYPFAPAGQLFRWMMIVIILATAAVVYVVAGINQNELIARVHKVSPDRSLFNIDFVTKLMTYAAPLVALLAAFSYGFGDMLAVILGPFLSG